MRMFCTFLKHRSFCIFIERHIPKLNTIISFIAHDKSFVPARQKELFEKKDFGQYAGPDGDVPVCFLTNLDITGGNSGSPVMDAEGNLIGLAFDGNWEAMSGDVIFEPDLQRCICVDIRYVLWMMDKFGGATYLLDEMNIVK